VDLGQDSQPPSSGCCKWSGYLGGVPTLDFINNAWSVMCHT
jgi:hypothetical protein